GIAKKVRDVDQDGIEQQRELGRMGLEKIAVAAVVLDVGSLHPLLDAPLEARPLVGGEIESTTLVQVVEQGLELHRGVPCFGAHAASPRTMSLVSAGPMS